MRDTPEDKPMSNNALQAGKPANRPALVWVIRQQPKTGKYALRDGKARLLGVFDTYGLAEREASERFPEPRGWRFKA